MSVTFKHQHWESNLLLNVVSTDLLFSEVYKVRLWFFKIFVSRHSWDIYVKFFLNCLSENVYYSYFSEKTAVYKIHFYCLKGFSKPRVQSKKKVYNWPYERVFKPLGWPFSADLFPAVFRNSIMWVRKLFCNCVSCF